MNTKHTYCKSCGKELIKKAVRCCFCGQKNPLMKTMCEKAQAEAESKRMCEKAQAEAENERLKEMFLGLLGDLVGGVVVGTVKGVGAGVKQMVRDVSTPAKK